MVCVDHELRHWRRRARSLFGRGGALRAAAIRWREIVVFSAAAGAVTGLGVALFERVVVEGMYDHFVDLSPWLLAWLPLVGLGLTAISLRGVARSTSTDTTDAYLQAFHDPVRSRLRLAEVPGRILASICTLGFGGAMGLEGPSIYLGASIGSAVQHHVRRLSRTVDARMLLVAGAAGGVAAIFKAPATGAVFAIESPYRDDFARRMLLPSLVGATSSYLVFVAINGTQPLFPVHGAPPFSFADLGGAMLIGVAAGLAARAFSALLAWAKRVASRAPAPYRIAAAGVALAVLFALTYQATGEPIGIGVGYDTLRWATRGSPALWLLVFVLVERCVATGATVAGGGVGGLFIPLVVAGALLGRVAVEVVGDPHTTLFVVVGVAAFLGAGYRVPLAAVMFVAETTGRPGFVIPGVIAAVAAELVVGASSVTRYQRAGVRLHDRDASEEDGDDEPPGAAGAPEPRDPPG
jgi:CIC family chloride channel protein